MEQAKTTKGTVIVVEIRGISGLALMSGSLCVLCGMKACPIHYKTTEGSRGKRLDNRLLAIFPQIMRHCSAHRIELTDRDVMKKTQVINHSKILMATFQRKTGCADSLDKVYRFGSLYGKYNPAPMHHVDTNMSVELQKQH